jgi:hypothetical protein
MTEIVGVLATYELRDIKISKELTTTKETT